MSDDSHALVALSSTERVQLEAFVHDNRHEVLGLLDDISEEQARERLVPSATTLLGLVKHAAFVERVWFGQAVGGASRQDLGIPETVEESFVLSDDDTIASVCALYRKAVADAEQITSGLALDDLALHHQRLGPMSLRWIYVHLIEELARHAGHGDILREQILAAGAHEASPG